MKMGETKAEADKTQNSIKTLSVECRLHARQIYSMGTCQITHHVASFQGQHGLVCAYDAEEWVLSS
jgi:hypothetical protein